MTVSNNSNSPPGLLNEDQIMEWNRDLPSPEPCLVHDLIKHNLRTHPNAPAICAWNGQFSYSELEAHASHLANRLIQLGAGPEQFVPLCFEKSAFAVISLLAVLKAGAACVLLDPAHPIERLHSMISDLKANLMLCSPGVRPHFDMAMFENVSFLEITEDLLKNLPAPDVQPPAVQPENAAIGLFTSGSTGKPKGIIQNHSTAAFSAQICSRVFGISKGSRVLQWAAYCFDMSVIDMLMTLVGGACICVPSEEERTDNLVQVMREMKVDTAAMTPSFAQTVKSEGVSSLRTLIFGGEPVSKDHLTGWPDHVHIINAYGPAEGSVCVAGLANRKCPANVGKAVGSVTWIVDESDPAHLAPIGAIGELLIEGPLLARGYLNDSEKTAASFLEDLPWLLHARGLDKVPKRVYKTGDLAHYGEGGSIILIGRKDTQIKLRGQRIETSEVEHNLKLLLPDHFTVIVDVVSPVMRKESQILVAFIGLGTKSQFKSDAELFSIDSVFTAELAPYLNGIEGHLRQFLPTYMIPSYFIPVQSIPLTASGKVDRKRLRQIGSNSNSTIAQYLSEQSIDGIGGLDRGSKKGFMEEVSELWQSTLGLEFIPTDPSSNFFGLGGDSILAMKLVTMARNAGLDLSTKQVFEYRTLAAMASVVQPSHSPEAHPSDQETNHRSSVSAYKHSLTDIFCPNHMLMDRDIENVVEAPDMQSFMVVCGLLKSHGYINYFAFDFDQCIDPDRLEFACKTLVAHHSALRTIFGIRGTRVLQIVLTAYTPEFRRLSSQLSTEVVLSTLCETEKMCDSKLGDHIVSFALIERTSARPTLIMRISHAQFDGTSLGLIYNDLKKAYNGQVLDPVSQFTDFSRIVKKENNAAAEAYWRNLLRGSRMTSIVLHSKSCYAKVINRKEYLSFSFQGIDQSNITLATVVKAAWALVLAEMASTRDVVFGYAVTGREIPLKGIENVVGDCNNASLARITIKETETVLELLNRVQRQYIDTIPYQSMGLRQMVEKCTSWPRWTRYSTSVNHQNYTDAGVESFQIGEAVCKVGYRDLESDRRDVQVYSWPPKEGQMRVAMAFCDQSVPGDLVQIMLEALAKRIQSFAVDMEAPLIAPPNSFCHIPLQTPLPSSNNTGDELPRFLRFSLSILDSAALVLSVWERFLGICSNDLLEGFDVTDDLPFYTFAGDLVYATQMSAFYEEAGVGFSMELLIENATKRTQRKLLDMMLK